MSRSLDIAWDWRCIFSCRCWCKQAICFSHFIEELSVTYACKHYPYNFLPSSIPLIINKRPTQVIIKFLACIIARTQRAGRDTANWHGLPPICQPWKDKNLSLPCRDSNPVQNCMKTIYFEVFYLCSYSTNSLLKSQYGRIYCLVILLQPFH